MACWALPFAIAFEDYLFVVYHFRYPHMTRKGPQNGQKALGFPLKVVDLGISQRHLSFIMACMDLGILVYLGVASKSIYGGGGQAKVPPPQTF